ncbi:MAG: PIN domain-containing protein [Acidobacteriota bacterium]
MKKAVLDANVLVLLVVGAADPSLIERHKRTEIFAEEDFDTLTRFLKPYLKLQVTPHALAEASNLLAQSKSPAREQLRQALAHLLGTLVEVCIPSETAVRNEVYLRLGLTDATLAEAVARGATLLTTDLDLYRAVQAQGYLAVNFNHVRLGAWG